MILPISPILLILSILLGFFLGIYATLWHIRITNKNQEMKSILDKNEKFKQILNKLLTKKTRFKTRVNNTVYIGINLDGYGKVDILYFLEKRDIAIYKGDKCILTSKDVDVNLLNDIVNNIDRVHYYKIIDIVEFLGFIIYREDFERYFNINIDNFMWN